MKEADQIRTVKTLLRRNLNWDETQDYIKKECYHNPEKCISVLLQICDGHVSELAPQYVWGFINGWNHFLYDDDIRKLYNKKWSR